MICDSIGLIVWSEKFSKKKFVTSISREPEGLSRRGTRLRTQNFILNKMVMVILKFQKKNADGRTDRQTEFAF